MSTLHRSPAGRRINRRATLATAAEYLWDALTVLILYVAPIGWALITADASLVHDSHPLLAGTLTAAVYIAGVGGVMLGCRRPAATVQQVNRRAARILPAAGIGLALLVQLLADYRPVVLVAAAGVAGCVALGAVVAFVGRLVRRVVIARRVGFVTTSMSPAGGRVGPGYRSNA